MLKMKMESVIQNALPTVMVPLHLPFEPLADDGARILAASDGFWYEVKTPWLYLRIQIAEQNLVQVPYGSISPHIKLAFSEYPVELFEKFEAQLRGRQGRPLSAQICWSRLSGLSYEEFIPGTEYDFNERYKALHDDDEKFKVFEMHYCSTNASYRRPLSENVLEGVYFISQYEPEITVGQVNKKSHLRVGKMAIPMEEVIDMLSKSCTLEKC